MFSRFLAAFSGALDLHLRRYALEWSLVVLILLCGAFCVYFTLSAPQPYPSGAVVIIEKGTSAHATAEQLGKARLVRFPQVLELLWRVTKTGDSIRPGAYRFIGPENVVTIARRIIHGTYGIPSVRITFPEGTTVLDMGKKVSKALPEISLSEFITAAGPYEGYLFPDTYTFQPSATAATVVARMQQEFAAKTAPLAPEIAASGHSLQEIIVMASIIEREAAREGDRKMISGILWNRVRMGMPLQVDAVFGYIYSRQTYSPSYHDLGVDSPYNTYHHAGLPPGPISNPSLSSIEAALHPAQTKDIFYLTGRDGLMYYAVTYKQHAANLANFLR